MKKESEDEEEGEDGGDEEEEVEVEWLEGVGEVGRHAGQRQAAGMVGFGRPEQLKCTQPLQIVHWNEKNDLR